MTELRWARPPLDHANGECCPHLGKRRQSPYLPGKSLRVVTITFPLFSLSATDADIQCFAGHAESRRESGSRESAESTFRTHRKLHINSRVPRVLHERCHYENTDTAANWPLLLPAECCPCSSHVFLFDP